MQVAEIATDLKALRLSLLLRIRELDRLTPEASGMLGMAESAIDDAITELDR